MSKPNDEGNNEYLASVESTVLSVQKTQTYFPEWQ